MPDSIGRHPITEIGRRLTQVSKRLGTDYTDGGFMASRDAHTFRVWPEAFIRPGPEARGRWVYGDNYQNWGVVETKSDIPGTPNELSVYVSEGYWRGNSAQLRRYTLRMDGFVSVHAPLSGGEAITKPIVFSGSKLALNVSTSAAGSVRVEIQDVDGKPVDGFALADCPEIFGDAIERGVSWRGGTDVSVLTGRPVRLRFVMKDADVYAFRFSD